MSWGAIASARVAAGGVAIRSESIGLPVVYGNVKSMTVNWPAGNTAGDCVLAFVGNQLTGHTVSADSFTEVATAAAEARTTVLAHYVTTPQEGLFTVVKTSTSNTQVGLSVRFSKTGGSWDVAASTAINLTVSTTTIDLDFSTPLDVRAGDILIVACTVGTYGTNCSSPVLTVPGLVIGSPTRDYISSSSGGDAKIDILAYPVLSGEATSTASFTAGNGTSNRASDVSGVLTRLRAV